MYCYHRKTDGSDWNIAIENPLKNFDYNRGNDAGGEGAGESTEGVSGGAFDYLGAVRVHDKAVVTSGGYERYFEQDGKGIITSSIRRRDILPRAVLFP